MIKNNPRLAAEMAVIVMIASLIGLVFNQRLLRDVMAGKAVQTAVKNETTAQPLAATPLPIGLQQAKELYDSKEAVFVDARDHSAYAAGHIKGAVSLPLGEFNAALPSIRAKVKAGTPLIAYCNGFDCHDSMDLANRLLKAGYDTAYVYLGGFPEWKDAGYAVEGGNP